MTDGGLESWTADLSTRERVRKIATTLTQPRSVEWIRKEAHVSSWGTVKDELEMLAEFGQVLVVEGDDGNAKYAPNHQLRYFTELTELINNHARDELREEIADVQAEIDAYKTEFNVDSQSALEATLTDDALDSEAVRQRNTVLRQWEHFEETKRLLQHALELYDDLQAVHPSETDSSASPPPVSQ